MIPMSEIKELLADCLDKKEGKIQSIEKYEPLVSKHTQKMRDEYWELWSKSRLRETPDIHIKDPTQPRLWSNKPFI